MERVSKYDIESVIEGVFDTVKVDSNEKLSRILDLKYDCYRLYKICRAKFLYHIFMTVMLVIILFFAIVNIRERLGIPVRVFLFFASLVGIAGNWMWYQYEVEMENFFLEELLSRVQQYIEKKQDS